MVNEYFLKRLILAELVMADISKTLLDMRDSAHEYTHEDGVELFEVKMMLMRVNSYLRDIKNKELQKVPDYCRSCERKLPVDPVDLFDL